MQTSFLKALSGGLLVSASLLGAATAAVAQEAGSRHGAASVSNASSATSIGRVTSANTGAAVDATVADRETFRGEDERERGGEGVQRGQARPAPGGVREPALRINVLFHIGTQWLTAKDSFDAILGSHSGIVFGGGAEVAHRSGLFVRGDVSRFREEGERVFVSNGQVFPLGQPLTVTLTPIEFTGGYRFFTRQRAGARRGPRLLPYAGAGVGVVRYREASESDRDDETIEENFTSYHVLAGVDVPFSRMFSVGAEFLHRWVPDGLGEGGVSQAFGETDLGGNSIRAQFRVHF